MLQNLLLIQCLSFSLINEIKSVKISNKSNCIGTYTLQYLVTETGTGSWTFIPSVRELSVGVAKKSPVINYQIPNYLSLRAAIPFEIGDKNTD